MFTNASFRDNLSSGVNFLRRRFSSDDLQQDADLANLPPQQQQQSALVRIG